MLRCCSAQVLDLRYYVSYGRDDDLGLFGGYHVPGPGLNELAKSGPACQIHLKLMPIDGQPILFGTRGAGEPLMFQDD